MPAPPAKAEISATYPNPSNATARTGFDRLWETLFGTSGLLGSTGNQADARLPLGIDAVGQCRLTKSGSNLLLSRHNGKFLTINNVNCTIPSGGITLAATSLSAGTTYNIYATASAGAVATMEASTTAYAIDTTSGMPVKSGDATRTLVGMARIITGPAWSDTAAQRFVISWFNRRPIRSILTLSGNVSTTSGSFVEVEATFRLETLSWAGDIIALGLAGSLECSAVGTVSTVLFTNGAAGTATTEAATRSTIPTAAYIAPACTSTTSAVAADGYTYIGMNGLTNAGTATWHGSGTAGTRCSLWAVVQG